MSTLPFSRFEITRFRGLRGLALEGLGRINLLVGTNNSGKTSVLEALSLCTAPLDPRTWIATAQRRDPWPSVRRADPEKLRWLFPQTASAGPAEALTGVAELTCEGMAPILGLRATYEDVWGTPVDAEEEDAVLYQLQIPGVGVDQRGARVEISAKIAGPIISWVNRSFMLWESRRLIAGRRLEFSTPAAIVSPYDHWFRAAPAHGFSEAKRDGLEKSIVELLRQLDARVVDAEVLASRSSSARASTEAVLHLRDQTAGLLPLDAFGDGFRRALLMALAIPRAAGGVLLIDEIETAIHFSALAKVFRWMVEACHQHDVQLFVTTHSLEAIDAILGADPTPEEDIVAYRLERGGEETKARRYGEDLLKRLRFERGLEVR